MASVSAPCPGVSTKAMLQDVELAGSGAVMSFSYDDDEPGSLWTLVLHVDGRSQLGDVLLGRFGGEHLKTLPRRFSQDATY